jgi:hypothetical protein
LSTPGSSSKESSRNSHERVLQSLIEHVVREELGDMRVVLGIDLRPDERLDVGGGHVVGAHEEPLQIHVDGDDGRSAPRARGPVGETLRDVP